MGHYILFMQPYLAAMPELRQFVIRGNGPRMFLDGDGDEPTGPYRGLIEVGGHMDPYVPCFRQCGKASIHTNSLIQCLSDIKDGKQCERPQLTNETKTLLAFQG